MQNKPIGIFDSGLGGLTVLRQMIKQMPYEQFIYFGDTARVPYGSKSRETVMRYAIENSVFLLSKEIKALVIACNTASAFAVDTLRSMFKVPVLDVIQPSVQRAVSLSKSGKIALLGTKATVASGIYTEKIKALLPEADVTAIACPLFVPIVEEGFTHHAIAKLAVSEYLHSIKEKGVDTLILGCTHYPLLTSLISDIIGDSVSIVDSASSCSEALEKLLSSNELSRKTRLPPENRYFVSDDPEKFSHYSNLFLGHPISNVEQTS